LSGFSGGAGLALGETMSLITTPTVDRILACAIKVHTILGPGLFESVYENCLARQFSNEGLAFSRQVAVALNFEGLLLPCAFRADFIIAEEVLIEVKAVERVIAVHHSQVLTYLRCTGLRKGLLLNFNAPRLFIKSFVMGQVAQTAGDETPGPTSTDQQHGNDGKHGTTEVHSRREN